MTTRPMQGGQSRYTPDCGKIPNGTLVTCGVCQTTAEEQRDQFGPRGFAMAMSGSKSRYDLFQCPHRTEKWHRQAEQLMKLSRDTVSPSLAALYMKDANEVLSIRQEITLDMESSK